MKSGSCRALFLGVTLLLWPERFCLAGQVDDEPGANARMRLGDVRLAPSVAFNTGIDTNIFNASDQPSSDVISTLSSKTEAWMRAGPARVSGKGSVDFVYFQNTATERTVNLDGSIRLAVPLNHVEPYAMTSFLRTRERPAVEIDARSLRKEQSVSLGTGVRISGRSSVQFAATMSEVRFDAGAVFLETSLGDVLNRDDTTWRVSLRHQLTPLTTLTIGAETTDDRFVLSPLRNSRSIRVAPELEFAASALVSGRASVGYRAFDARDPSVPDFNGMVAAVDLAYTLLGSTRFTFQANRDVEYSYEITAPYYVIAGLGGGLVQRVTDSMGITTRCGLFNLNYRSLAPEAVNADSRVDSITFYGGGVIHKIGRDLRVSVNVDYNRRHSAVVWREYNSVRAGVSIVYGLKS